MNTPVAIAFSYPMEQTRVVPIDEVWSFVDQDSRLWDVHRVIWSDGTWSYGKCWWVGDLHPHIQGRMCQIGAGAYGDLTVLDRFNSLVNRQEN